MEDYELVHRLRKLSPPAIIPHALQTSGRRWQSVGLLQAVLINQVGVHAVHAQLLSIISCCIMASVN